MSGCRRRLFGRPEDIRVADSPWPGRARSPGPHSARCSRGSASMAPIRSPGDIAAASPDIFEVSDSIGASASATGLSPGAPGLGASGMDPSLSDLDDTGLGASATADTGPSLAGKYLN